MPREAMQKMITSVTAFVVALLLLATPHKIEGFALARRTCKIHFVPIDNTRGRLHKETVVLKSSASTSIETPDTISPQRSLNGVIIQ